MKQVKLNIRRTAGQNSFDIWIYLRWYLFFQAGVKSGMAVVDGTNHPQCTMRYLPLLFLIKSSTVVSP